MTTTGIHGFNTTIQKTDIWIKEIMGEMGWTDREKAYLPLCAVLHTLRDRLTVEEAAELGAQLPMLVRGFYSSLLNTPTVRSVDEAYPASFSWDIM